MQLLLCHLQQHAAECLESSKEILVFATSIQASFRFYKLRKKEIICNFKKYYGGLEKKLFEIKKAYDSPSVVQVPHSDRWSIFMVNTTLFRRKKTAVPIIFWEIIFLYFFLITFSSSVYFFRWSHCRSFHTLAQIKIYILHRWCINPGTDLCSSLFFPTSTKTYRNIMLLKWTQYYLSLCKLFY